MERACEESPCQSRFERRLFRRYCVEILGAVVVLFVLVLYSQRFVSSEAGALRFGTALLPMVGVSGMLVAIVRLTLSSDELQRRVLIYASAIAFGTTLFITMALGCLEDAGVSRLSWTLIWPIGILSWGVALAVLKRWYR